MERKMKMTDIIVTPLYGISEELGRYLQDCVVDGFERTIVLIDDESPVFPVDTRREWIDKVFVGHKFTIVTTDAHQDSEDLEEGIMKALVWNGIIKKGEEKEVKKRLVSEVKIGSKKPKFKQYQPADIKDEGFDLFIKRFGRRFNDLLHFRGSMSSIDEVVLVPYFIKEGKKTFVITYSYKLEDTNPLAYQSNNIDLDTYGVRLAVVGGLISSLNLDPHEDTIKYLGTINGSAIYVVEIDDPRTDPSQLYTILDDVNDFLFVAEESMNDVMVPLGSWVLNLVNKALEVSPE